MKPLEHNAAKINVGTRRTLKCDLYDAPLDGRRLVVAFDVVGAYHVQDYVRAGTSGRSFRKRNEILSLVVDGEIGAECAASIAFRRTSGCRNNARTERLGELDRNGPDTRTTAMHQQCFAGLEAAACEQIVPDREEGFWNRSGFSRGEAAWNRQGMGFVGGAVLRVAAAADQSGDVIAGLPAPASRTARHNHSG